MGVEGDEEAEEVVAGGRVLTDLTFCDDDVVVEVVVVVVVVVESVAPTTVVVSVFLGRTELGRDDSLLSLLSLSCASLLA